MSSVAAIQELLESVLQEGRFDEAIKIILDTACKFTRSRNVLFALLNREEGQLDFEYGSGPDWLGEDSEHSLAVDIGKRTGITAQVAATGKPFVTGNVAEVAVYHQLYASTKSEMAIPVRDSHGKLQAVLDFESDLLDNFGEADVEMGKLFASVAAFVLEREIARAREEALVEIGAAIDDALTEEEILSRVIDVAERVLRFQACSIFLFDDRTQTFVLRASTGALRDRVDKLSYLASEGFTGWVCSEGKSILLERPQSDPRWRGKYTEIPSEEIASFLAVPILIRGKSIGAIRALRKIPDNEFLDNRFTAADERLLVAISDQTAIAIDSVRAIGKLVQNERLSAWGELSAKSSHMIGNRVFALRGDANEFEYQLSRDPIDVDELKSLQKGFGANINRLQELLQEFRDFVTAAQLHLTEGDLNELVRETVQEVFPKRSTVHLEMTLDESIPILRFDASKLRRAISELIENSLHFVENGHASVSTRFADANTLALAKLGPIGRFVEISIEDSGPGVAENRKEVIFEPFHSSRVKGMGLGLSIVKGIANAHGGTVLEMGEEGNGAKFVILLPTSDRQNSGGI
jgi:signal transduction histidine kinase